jgi:uncharacterized protein YjiS (DUF1127 family)
MTCTQLTSVNHRLPSTQAARITGILGRLWHAYWDWRARQATILILRALDKRTLHDIGVNPSEIESFIYGKRGERRRGYDETWWRH